jgi:hypothetical protein
VKERLMRTSSNSKEAQVVERLGIAAVAMLPFSRAQATSSILPVWAIMGPATVWGRRNHWRITLGTERGIP